MTPFRISMGIVSLVLGLLIAAGSIFGFWTELRTPRQSSGSLTFDFVEVGPFRFAGWQIYAYYSILALIAVGFIFLAVRLFSSRKSAASCHKPAGAP